jgi:hypothetical protein
MSAKSESNTQFEAVLESAAHLQRLVPDAVLVGGTAAALHAAHRISLDHDHVLADLRERFAAVLDAVENDDGWATNRIAPGKIILGNLDGVETGIRQMIRSRPLETERITLANTDVVVAPTIEETLRVKAFLVVRRNTVRDYLDCAALADRIEIPRAAGILNRIDDYYADQIGDGDGIATQVLRQFADPRPVDAGVIAELSRYKGLNSRWADWTAVTAILAEVSAAMLASDGSV